MNKTKKYLLVLTAVLVFATLLAGTAVFAVQKDDDEKVKLTKAIRSVAHKNIEQIAVWTEAHPEYMNYNSKYSEKYMKLIGEAMPGATYEESDKNYKKIARNITKETIIEK